MKQASVIKLRSKKELRLWLATLPQRITMGKALELLQLTKGKGWIVWVRGEGFHIY